MNTNSDDGDNRKRDVLSRPFDYPCEHRKDRCQQIERVTDIHCSASGFCFGLLPGLIEFEPRQAKLSSLLVVGQVAGHCLLMRPRLLQFQVSRWAAVAHVLQQKLLELVLRLVRLGRILLLQRAGGIPGQLMQVRFYSVSSFDLEPIVVIEVKVRPEDTAVSGSGCADLAVIER